MAEEALQIAEKIREAKGKGEKGKVIPIWMQISKEYKERYESLPWWSMQRKEDNNRMGKTRDLLKKIRDTKGKGK